MNKLFRITALTLTLLLGATSIPTFANTSNNETIYYEDTIITNKFIDTDLIDSSNITPFNNYGESQKVTNLTTYSTIFVTPNGQPSLGYEGGSGANVFFFQSGGSKTNFTVKIDYKNVTFTAEAGQTKSSGSGYSDKVPSSSGKYRFQFRKSYTIKSKKIDVYKYGVYQYTYYVHDPSYSLNHRWVKL